MFGVLAINKPGGMTSRDVVNRIQRICKPHKVGHTGTLDPMATGVLLVAVGKATRLVEFSHDLDKEYNALFELGKSSDTLDTDGQVVEHANAAIISESQIERACKSWIGSVQQVPPKYSAINIGGRRAHELARQGTEFELPSREVRIHQIQLKQYEYPRFRLTIRCGSGTYVRSLGRDIAHACGTVAVMSKLTRTRIGPVSLGECSELERVLDSRSLQGELLPPQLLLGDAPRIVLSDEGAHKLRNGISITELHFSTESTAEQLRQAKCLAAFDDRGELAAVVRCAAGANYRSLRVFQTANETPQPNSKRIPQMPES